MTVRAFVYHDSIPADSPVVRLTVRESLSKPFDIECEFLCADPDMDLDALLWSTIAFAIADDHAPEGQPQNVRTFHGIVEEAEYLYIRQHTHAYRVRVRPRLHGLAYRVRTRIFQGKNVIDIAKEVFEGAAIPADTVDWTQLSGSVEYPVRDFCLQWKESELAFVMRLFEEEGVIFWHDHSEVEHTLVVIDDVAKFAPIDGNAVIRFSWEYAAGREAVYDLVYSSELVTNRHVTRDWNFLRPTPLTAVQPGEDTGGESESGGAAGGTYERYEYPGGFDEQESVGGRLAHNRLVESALDEFVLQGKSNCLRMQAGRKVAVIDAKPDFFVNEYLLVDVEHRFVDMHHGAAGTSSQVYETTFRAQPSSVEFRPRRRTPVPSIPNKESAVVTTSGDEIEPDEWGRIHVHFYWDRENPLTDKASCWIRMQQLNTDGAMIHPRVGWELDVGFLDGDPNRPIALQKMYNQETMPPYGLPGAKTKTAIQTPTTPGGGACNELRFEDGAGSQEVYCHASKNYFFDAGNDHTEDVGVDATEDVGTSYGSHVGGAESYTVTGDQSISVTGPTGQNSSAACSIHVAGTEDKGVKGSYSNTTDAARTDHISGTMNVVAFSSVTETFKADCTRSVGGVQSINAAQAIMDNAGGAHTEFVGAAKATICGGGVAENVGAAKIMLSGAVTEKTGADIGMTAKGAITFAVAGSITETCGEDMNVGAKVIGIATGNLSIKVGGSTLTAKGGKLTVKAGSMGGSGGPTLKLKGSPINFKP